ncbi:hypothetical protein [Amycolatopsis dongchuanensis]|uniref:PH domain-containing protein n=1 Tax=Amycolatopsis dongchuanensis TaxID=1070866 RepID=A0ABP8VBV0_9PSEU
MIPVAHLPAFESDSTALHLAHLRERGRVPWGWLAWIGLLVVLHAASGFEATDFIGLPVGLAAWLGWTVWRRLRFVRWTRPAEALLREQPWLPVDVSLRGRRIVAGGTVFALPGMPREVRNVIARTGRVWFVGPDGGLAVIRVEGSGRPWRARVRRRAGRVTAPRAVDHWWRKRRRFRLAAGFAGLFAAALVALLVATVIEPPAPDEIAYVLVAYGMVVVPLAALVFVARRSRPPAPGTWTRIAGAVDDADYIEDDEPLVHGWAVLPEIGPVEVEIGGCPLDLYTDIWFHRRMYVLGRPRPGEVVLGLPGFPVTATAFLGGEPSLIATSE